MAFALEGPRAPTFTPATRIGEICHQILQKLAEDRVEEEGAQAWVESEWKRHVDELRREIKGTEEERVWGPPEYWPNLEIKRARLRIVGTRLASLLNTMTEDGEFLTELEVDGLKGKLRGRIDLLIRTPSLTWVIDYKTGDVFESGSADVRATYNRQLKLYALLAAEKTGHWPDRAFLLPLHGEFADIAVDRDECIRLGNEAIELLEAYNAAAPGPQTPALTIEACGVCPFASRCEPFWTKLHADWQPDVLAVRGTVERVLRSRVGGVSLFIRNSQGSLETEEVLVRNIDQSTFPQLEGASQGDLVAITGLRPETGRPSYRVTGRTSVWVERRP